MPLYVVIFFDFVGYSLMITVFTPMLLGSRSAMLAADAAASRRAIVLGLILCLDLVEPGRRVDALFLTSLASGRHVARQRRARAGPDGDLGRRPPRQPSCRTRLSAD